jgi:anti-sigma factor RsiW
MNKSVTMDQEMEIRLWEYIDGTATEPQRSAVTQLIAEHAEWRALYEELLRTHLLLTETSLEEPSMRFGRNVMEAIAREQIAPAARHYINKRVIWSIAGLFLALIGGALVYGIAGADSSNNDGGSTSFSSMDFSKAFTNNWVNIFLMLNILLGLFLLDRFLSARQQRHLDHL